MGSPLRVLHVVVNMNRGGAETLIMNLYRNMDRTKVQFDFLTYKEGAFDAEIKALGGKVHRIPYITEAGHRGFIRGLRNFLRSNPDYKIIHSHMDKMSGFVLRAARKENVPIRIAHSHNTESEGNFLARTYKWYAGSQVQAYATHYYACSKAAANWLFKNKARKAFILKNGIETNLFQYCQETRKSIRSELKINEDTLVLGHVGRFSPQKNHLFLLDIFAEVNKKLPDSVLVLAGDGPLKTELKEKVTALKLDKKVRFLGIREDIHKLLQAFDLFVFPSFHEGLPVTLIEAQGSGLSCFISDTITNEVDMKVGLIKHLPLANKEKWIKQITDFNKNKQTRKINQQALNNQGYDIRKTAELTQTSYLSLGEKAV
ncbi:glycosyl transferase family 1 [Virgibacillus profundi]|uniref:Glycosyl transferase family 1 n=1 Tax=Virgibacillus profundi TaxID=2024555 RepID=A0A2A2IJR3_9BACI|nr:glycosyltransferase family 1 protein [Virgibacillus profundi]PAV31556.1 glycosyl transferase family 1 [Virgibacillus profundi]PXY55742.1 glycosyltransferase family 1 protein [Virgibacillus profundi]